MKSGVYYLYEYKNDQKSRNVGFVKFAQHPDSYFLQICTRGIPVFHGDQATLSLLYSTDDSILVMPCQTIKCENHAITCKLTFSSSDFEPSSFGASGSAFSNLGASGSEPSAFKQSDSENLFCGFLIELPDKTLLVAAEEGVAFSTQKCRIVTEEINNNTETRCDESEIPMVDDSYGCEAAAVPMAGNSCGCEAAVVPMAGNNCSCGTTVDTPMSGNSCNCGASADTPQQLIRKIQRKELSILPRRYWNLSNNRFLLHGYYNYNHLLLVEENGYFLVGVPGIYDKREARAADLFGFPTFSESYTKSLDLSSEETAEQGRFGYWCKKIPVGS